MAICIQIQLEMRHSGCFPCLLAFLLLFLPFWPMETMGADLIEFLFQNQRICGQPFADAQWVPVLDLCELDCKPEEICMEDDQMKQSLPEQCFRAFQTQQKALKTRAKTNAIASPPASQQKHSQPVKKAANDGAVRARTKKQSRRRSAKRMSSSMHVNVKATLRSSNVGLKKVRRREPRRRALREGQMGSRLRQRKWRERASEVGKAAPFALLAQVV